MSDMLRIENLILRFGGISAIDGISFDIPEREITALIGPNGAGKTSVFNCITGFYPPTSGRILITENGIATDISGKNPSSIAREGIARTFQNIRLFNEMTALENVMIGMDKSLTSGAFSAIFKTPAFLKEERETVERSFELLRELGLSDSCNIAAKKLPYGARRRLEIARALAAVPRLLLLDEPAAGMNHNETRELDDLILNIRDNRGIAILLIEHDMSLVMRISERVLVMDYGRLIADGTPDQIRHNHEVIEAYLGEDIDA
jgi:branched-chain amino acid transport system ATP-binding protein